MRTRTKDDADPGMHTAAGDWFAFPLLQTRDAENQSDDPENKTNDRDYAEDAQIVGGKRVRVLVWDDPSSRVSASARGR